MVAELARDQGLAIPPDVARQISEAAGGNRALVEQELVKLALYIDAAPGHPREVDRESYGAVAAAVDEGELGRLVDAVAGGNSSALETELSRLASQGVDGIGLLRPVVRRMMLLARLRSEVERGNSPGAVMASQGKSIFWKEKDAVGQQLSRWTADLLATAVARLLEAERQVKAPGALGAAAVNEELFAICRRAARLR
jgi:DNA polymerase-3 subunit delta